MQSLRWYIQRLRAMSPGEVARRVRSTVIDATGRPVAAVRRRQRPLSAIVRSDDGTDVPAFRVTDLTVGEWSSLKPGNPEYQWYKRLIEKADLIVSHRLSFFDLENCHLGDPIDWNRDHKSGKAAPMKYSPAIDYRDAEKTGDCKFVWEPNRHHHLVVLGRAYRVSGDVRYAAAVIEQLDSWLQQCPYGLGMNWRSPLELAIRLINWIWTFDLIQESGVINSDFYARFLYAIHLHLGEITLKYSYGSSANNHIVGEAAGVFVATSYFPQLKNARRWNARSREMLSREIIDQTYGDGGTREQAIGYHLFVLQFFLLTGLIARHVGQDFPAAYWSRLERMFEFAGALSEGGDLLPAFGDCDDGYVLDLGSRAGDVRSFLSIGAVLYERSDFKAMAAEYTEPGRWLLGRSSGICYNTLPELGPSDGITSRAFRDTGYYLLQCGARKGADRLSVVFDCGELGFKSIAAHGHADALSFTLRAFGRDVFVDPGTYDYFSYPQWRTYFRSTRAHNTIVVDGKDQSEMLGPFLWGRRAQARCLDWQPTGTGGTVTGEHDGYTRLSDPVVHRRTLELDGENRKITVSDQLITRGRHDVDVYFHLAEHCCLRQVGPGRYEIEVGPGVVTLVLDPRLSVNVLTGSDDPIAGWVSRGYHHKAAATTIIGHCVAEGQISLTSQIEIAGPESS